MERTTTKAKQVIGFFFTCFDTIRKTIFPSTIIKETICIHNESVMKNLNE